MDRGRDQRDREQGKAGGCDGRRKSGCDHGKCAWPVSRESCTSSILANPLLTASAVCPEALLCPFEGYHEHYNFVIKSLHRLNQVNKITRAKKKFPAPVWSDKKLENYK